MHGEVVPAHRRAVPQGWAIHQTVEIGAGQYPRRRPNTWSVLSEAAAAAGDTARQIFDSCRPRADRTRLRVGPPCVRAALSYSNQ